MGITESALTQWLNGEGFTVVEFSEDSTVWGYTCPVRREVALRANLRTFQRVPTLLHECWHVHLRHDGHQSPATEAWINERVAHLLVDADEYAWAESQYGWHTGGIAHALELPRWVVEAYRRVLARQSVCVT